MPLGKPCNSKKIVPLRVNEVSFPGGVHKRLHELATMLVAHTQKGYKLRDGWCWGYACRKIANTNLWSYHAYGAALDLNAPKNARGTEGEIPMRFVRTWEEFGWTWGGRWNWTDPMHFEFHGGKIRAWRMTRRARRRLRKTGSL